VGLSIDDPRWNGYQSESSLRVGGGNWLRSSWHHTFPLLHPRKHGLKGSIVERTLAQIKNMQLSVGYLQGSLEGFRHRIHFWDDFNFTYPLKLAASKTGIDFIVHQHAPSFTSIHVTGQILQRLQHQKIEHWACWDQDWERVAEKLSSALVFNSTEAFSPRIESVFYDKAGVVVFPWEAFCDNSAKKKAIKFALERELSVAIKLRPGEFEEHEKLSFGIADLDQVLFFHDWSELKQGVRCVIGGQTALIYQSFKRNVPVVVLEYLSETYSTWLDTKQSLEGITRCRSEEQLLLALQALE
jgi:hypothetical protein